MYIVVGANGFLGSYFIKNILEKTDENILALARNIPPKIQKRVQWMQCDIANAADVQQLNEQYCSKNKDNKIVYLAAYHHPDLVEKNPRIAWNINVTALSGFMNMIDNVSFFLYPSSDSVYGESINQYVFSENDALNPVNRYGIQKSVAERLVTAYGYHVVRYPFLIGSSLLEHKKHFYDVIVETIKNGNKMEMFADSYRSTLSFDDAAKYAIDLMQLDSKRVPSVLNICGDDALSKYDVGLMIADYIGVSRDLITPISINGDSGVFEAKRASSTLMDNSRLKEILGLNEVKLSFN